MGQLAALCSTMPTVMESLQKMALGPGTQAPDFTLNTHSGQVTLSELRGKTVVIGFHPASFTGG
tara:strand:- start:415 stop:606 length:192 start_codon:yes stop_codon:yes gene_type:complete